MNGIPIKYNDNFQIRVVDKICETLILSVDEESLKILENNPNIQEVSGYIIKENHETEQGIKFNAWLFHIESFTGC